MFLKLIKTIETKATKIPIKLPLIFSPKLREIITKPKKTTKIPTAYTSISFYLKNQRAKIALKQVLHEIITWNIPWLSG